MGFSGSLMVFGGFRWVSPGFLGFRSVSDRFRSSSVRFGSDRFDSVRLGSAQLCSTRFGSVWFGSVWFVSVSFRFGSLGVGLGVSLGFA